MALGSLDQFRADRWIVVPDRIGFFQTGTDRIKTKNPVYRTEPDRIPGFFPINLRKTGSQPDRTNFSFRSMLIYHYRTEIGLILGSSFRKFLAVLSKELLDGRSSFLGIRAIV